MSPPNDDGLTEETYRLIETTLDLLDYLPPTQAKVYLATYVAQTHEEKVRKPSYDLGARKVSYQETAVAKPGIWITRPGEKHKRFMRYMLWIDNKPLEQAEYELIGEGDEQHHVCKIPRGWQASEDLRKVPFLTVARFADPIYDDTAELRACDFPWAQAVGSLTEEFRRDLFERNLHDQKEMPQVPVDGRTWMKHLARYCTYDADGNYYPKWKAGKPGPNRVQTEKYLEAVEANRQEILLVKDRLYVSVWSKDFPGVLYSIDVEDKIAKRLVPHRMSKGLLWTLPTFNQNLTREFEVVFFATRDGAAAESEPARKGGYHLKDSDSASHEVVDPRKLVAASIGDDQLQHLHIAEDDEWGWFLQLAANVFPEPYYALDVAQAQSHPWVRQFGGIDKVREETNKFIEKSWAEAGPDDGKPVLAAARRIMRARMKSPHTLILPQGFPTSKHTRYLGSDGSYSFERDVDNGFVYVLPNVEYLGALAQGKFYADLYEDLAWLIPMMEGAAYIAAIAVGGGVAMSVRKFVIRQATKRAAEEIVREAIKSVIPALVAIVVDIVLELITKPVMHAYKLLDEADGEQQLPWDDAEAYVEIWQEFLRGFFDGYIHLNIMGRVAKVHDIVMPKEAKAVLLVTKLYDLVSKFRDFLERIQGVLTDGAIAKLLKNLERTAVHLITGFASALALLYYLDFEEAKPFLALFDAEDKPPDPQAWGAEVQKFFASVTAKLEEAGGGAASLRDLLDLGSTKPYAIGAAVGLGYISFLTTALKTTGHAGKVYLALGGMVLAFLAYEGKADEALGVAWELVKDVRHMIPGKDKKAAKLNGQLFGKLVGTFLVDKALFGEKSKLGAKLKKHKMLRIGVEGSLAGGLIGNLLRVLFGRYLLLARRITDKVRFVHDDLQVFVDGQRADKRADLEKAGLGRLNTFRAKSDDVMSFRELVSVMVHLRDVMARDKESFEASVSAGVAELKDDFAALNRLSNAAGYDIEKMTDREIRALMIQMNAHAYKALDSMLRAVDALFTEIADEQSVMTILQELGIDMGDLNNAHESVRKAIEPRMNGFKQEQKKLENKQAALDAKDQADQDPATQDDSAGSKKVMEGKPLR